MDLHPTGEQTLLADTASDVVARGCDTQTVRTLEAGEPGYDPRHWATMVELGWTDLGPVELALVADRLGRGPLPSPLVTTGALRQALPAFAAEITPDAVLTLAVLEAGERDEWAIPSMPGGGLLSGTKVLVPYASRADVIVVATRDGLTAVAPTAGGVTCTRHDTVGGEPLYRVDLAEAPARSVAGPVSTVLDHLAIAALAFAVGAAEGALTLAVRHAKDRHQFGRPIGSFQAVAHRCADMRAEIDACRVLAHRAAWALDRGIDVGFAVSSALAYSKDALRRVAMHAHQVHGAIGFSTEHDLHLYTRRIKAFELTYGSTARHQERLASAMGLR